jgi:hypothetical protein
MQNDSTIAPTASMTTALPIIQDQHPLLVGYDKLQTASTYNLTATTTTGTDTSNNELEYALLLEKLQAGAFRSLIQHLQLHSDTVSNLDLMTISGFCRNCLAKVCVKEYFSFLYVCVY